MSVSGLKVWRAARRELEGMAMPIAASSSARCVIRISPRSPSRRLLDTGCQVPAVPSGKATRRAQVGPSPVSPQGAGRTDGHEARTSEAGLAHRRPRNGRGAAPPNGRITLGSGCWKSGSETTRPNARCVGARCAHSNHASLGNGLKSPTGVRQAAGGLAIHVVLPARPVPVKSPLLEGVHRRVGSAPGNGSRRAVLHRPVHCRHHLPCRTSRRGAGSLGIAATAVDRTGWSGHQDAAHMVPMNRATLNDTATESRPIADIFNHALESQAAESRQQNRRWTAWTAWTGATGATRQPSRSSPSRPPMSSCAATTCATTCPP